jgi:hypothetical protein
MSTDRTPRVGLMRRGDRSAPPPAPEGDEDLATLIAAFHRGGVETEHVVWSDEAAEEVGAQLRGLDGVIVIVNPIQDGATRGVLDGLLREVAAEGVFVSTHPDVIMKMGTKEVLHQVRDLSCGSDVELYRSAEELATRFPARLGSYGRLVVKQGRGNGGNGVWKVDLLSAGAIPDRAATVRVQHARARDGSSEELVLGAFLDRMGELFAWSGCVVDQPYQARLADGMVRCYFSQRELVGFARQWPKGLRDFATEAEAAARSRPSVMLPPDTGEYAALATLATEQLVPALQARLDIGTDQLPVIWDADFLFGEPAKGEDRYVLCEVNVSAVLPFPLVASETIAATMTRMLGRP